MAEIVQDSKREASMKVIEEFVGVVCTDDNGVVWTCDGKGNVTPSDGGATRKVRDIVTITPS